MPCWTFRMKIVTESCVIVFLMDLGIGGPDHRILQVLIRIGISHGAL
jgi:hypothetical protein